MAWKKDDFAANLTPKDMDKFNRVIGVLQERNYSMRKPMIVKAMVRTFLARYVKLDFGHNQAPEWVLDPDEAIREIFEISKD